MKKIRERKIKLKKEWIREEQIEKKKQGRK